MSDFGDDIGNMLLNKVEQETQKFISSLQYGNYSRKYNEKSGEVMCTIPFHNEQQETLIKNILKDKGIIYQEPTDGTTAIIINQKDVNKVTEIFQDVKAEDYIKSWDGMDLDKSTLHNEVDTPQEYGFSWKKDIEDRVSEARDIAKTPDEFKRECENLGVKVTTAKDGEYMFVHSSGEHLKVRADTLNKRFSKKSFKKDDLTNDLDSVAKEARKASKDLYESEKTKIKDKEVPNFQQQTR